MCWKGYRYIPEQNKNNVKPMVFAMFPNTRKPENLMVNRKRWKTNGFPNVFSRGRSVSRIKNITVSRKRWETIRFPYVFTCRIKGAPAGLKVAPGYSAAEIKNSTLRLTEKYLKLLDSLMFSLAGLKVAGRTKSSTGVQIAFAKTRNPGICSEQIHNPDCSPCYMLFGSAN